nr:unnamed protein product [Digitaria exilis]
MSSRRISSPTTHLLLHLRRIEARAAPLRFAQAQLRRSPRALLPPPPPVASTGSKQQQLVVASCLLADGFRAVAASPCCFAAEREAEKDPIW